jgi:hypothetical protein
VAFFGVDIELYWSNSERERGRENGGSGSWLCEYALAEAWTGATSARWSCAVIFPGLAALSVWKCS